MRHYGTYYRPETLQVPSFIQQRLAEIVQGFERHRFEGRLLDVGFGAGGLLAAAEAAEWQCWGTEVSAAAIVAGRRRGWRVLEGDLCKIGLPADLFDVVCMVEVLAHVAAPLEYLRQAFRILRPGGLLYVTTPNGGGVNSAILGLAWCICKAPEHLQLFTPGGVRAALHRIGFRPARVGTAGLNPSQLRSAYSFRRNGKPPPDYGQAGFALNRTFSVRPGLRLIKRAANALLTLTGTGDTINIFATKPS